jgi:hypothetical protein
MLHLILQLLLGLESKVRDNSRLAGSLFFLGVWFLLIAEFFSRVAGLWRDWLVLAGWFLVGVSVYIYLRRKFWKWKAKRLPR